MRVFLVAGVLTVLLTSLAGGCTLHAGAEVEPIGSKGAQALGDLPTNQPPMLAPGRIYHEPSTGRAIDIQFDHRLKWRYRPEGAETVPMMVRYMVTRYSSSRGEWVKTSEVSDEELKSGEWRERLIAEAPAGW